MFTRSLPHIRGVINHSDTPFNPFSPDGVKSKIDKLSKNTNWVKLYHKVLLDSFPMNGDTLGFCPYNQTLENFVSLWKSKG